MAFWSKEFRVAHAQATIERMPFIVAVDRQGEEISNRAAATLTEDGMVTTAEPLTIRGPSWSGMRLTNAEGTETLDL